MGLKRFKAKLLWNKKEKEDKQQVVCLRYRVYSEFEEVPSGIVQPITSEVATRLQKFDVTKPKKMSPKPTANSIFETTSNASTDSVHSYSELNGYTEVNTTKPKGILKANKTTAPRIPLNNKNSLLQNEETQKKSTLTFMVQNHHSDDEPTTTSNMNSNTDDFERTYSNQAASIFLSEKERSPLATRKISQQQENMDSKCNDDPSVYMEEEEPRPKPRLSKLSQLQES